MAQATTVKPGKKVRLADFDPAFTGGLNKEDSAQATEKNIAVVDELSYRLYADRKRARAAGPAGHGHGGQRRRHS